MDKNIFIYNFGGMNNVNTKDASVHFESFMSNMRHPKVILNSDTTPDGLIKKRDGRESFITLSNAHSLFPSGTSDLGIMLCADEDTFYRLDSGNAVSLGSISGPKTQLSYAEVDKKVYISNIYWQAIYDSVINSLDDWGITLPPAPVAISSGTGSLEAGTYHIMFTRIVDNLESGNGPIIQCIVSTSESAISISNLPSDGIVWITEPNGNVFHPVGNTSTITAIPENVEPPATFMCCPPPPMSFIDWAFGRMWGLYGRKVYYSEPYRPDLFRLSTSYFDLPAIGRLIAHTGAGLYIADNKNTFFYHGDDPYKMHPRRVGEGVSFGSVSYVNGIGDLPDNTPVWVANNGIIAGSPEGRLLNLTKERIRINPGTFGTTTFREKDGIGQLITGFRKGQTGSAAGMGDDVVCEVIRNGSVI